MNKKKGNKENSLEINLAISFKLYMLSSLFFILFGYFIFFTYLVLLNTCFFAK